MADTQQGVRQQSARDAAGTLETYDGDLRALFEAQATIPPGSTFNDAFIAWLQDVTGSTEGNINDLAALFASQQDDTYNWSSVGPLLGGGGVQSVFRWVARNVVAPDAPATFKRAGTRVLATTIDGVSTWDQTLEIDEIPFGNARREHNFNELPDVIDWTLLSSAVVNGDRVDLPGPFSGTQHGSALPNGVVTSRAFWMLAQLTGDGTIDFTVKDAALLEIATVEITLSSTPTLFANKIEFTAAPTIETFVGEFRKNATSTATFIQSDFVDFVEGQIGNSNPPDRVAFDTYYNASDTFEQLTGIRWHDTVNGNTYDAGGTFQVTLGAGPTITLGNGPGFAPSAADADLLNAGVDYPEGGWSAVVEATGPSAPLGFGVGDVALGSLAGVPITIYMAASGLYTTNTYGDILQIAGTNWIDTLARVGVSVPETIGGDLLLAANGETTVTGITTSEDTNQIGIYRSTANQFGGTIHEIDVLGSTLSQDELEDLVAFP